MSRLERIRKNVDLWLSMKLNVSVDDVMPDIVFLLELIEEYEIEGKEKVKEQK